MKIIIFSEGVEHTRFLLPIIDKLLEFNNFQIDYFSLDKNEESKISKKINFHFIEKKRLLKVLRSITADYFFTTTPGIGSFYFPKSEKVDDISSPGLVLKEKCISSMRKSRCCHRLNANNEKRVEPHPFHCDTCAHVTRQIR